MSNKDGAENLDVSNEGYLIPSKKDRAYFKKLEVLIVIPHCDYTCSAKFAKCLSNLISYSWYYGLKIYQVGATERVVVDWARNRIGDFAQKMENPFTQNKYTHLLWLDDDHVFNPDMAIALARHKKDMVSGLYFSRMPPYTPSVFVKDLSVDDEYRHFPLMVAPNCLFEVDACGFGAMFMKRDVLDRVPEPWFTIDYKCGEDIGFCTHAKQSGIGIYCDGTYKLGHVGAPEIVTEDSYLAYQKKHPEEFGEKVKIKLGGEIIKE